MVYETLQKKQWKIISSGVFLVNFRTNKNKTKKTESILKGRKSRTEDTQYLHKMISERTNVIVITRLYEKGNRFRIKRGKIKDTKI